MIYSDGNLFPEKPPPCTLFYLSNCKHGADCKYGHDYELTNEHYDEIRVNAKKSPCPSKNKGNVDELRMILGGRSSTIQERCASGARIVAMGIIVR